MQSESPISCIDQELPLLIDSSERARCALSRSDPSLSLCSLYGVELADINARGSIDFLLYNVIHSYG